MNIAMATHEQERRGGPKPPSLLFALQPKQLTKTNQGSALLTSGRDIYRCHPHRCHALDLAQVLRIAFVYFCSGVFDMPYTEHIVSQLISEYSKITLGWWKALDRLDRKSKTITEDYFIHKTREIHGPVRANVRANKNELTFPSAIKEMSLRGKFPKDFQQKN